MEFDSIQFNSKALLYSKLNDQESQSFYRNYRLKDRALGSVEQKQLSLTINNSIKRGPRTTTTTTTMTTTTASLENKLAMFNPDLFRSWNDVLVDYDDVDGDCDGEDRSQSDSSQTSSSTISLLSMPETHNKTSRFNRFTLERNGNIRNDRTISLQHNQSNESTEIHSNQKNKNIRGNESRGGGKNRWCDDGGGGGSGGRSYPYRRSPGPIRSPPDYGNNDCRFNSMKGSFIIHSIDSPNQ